MPDTRLTQTDVPKLLKALEQTDQALKDAQRSKIAALIEDMAATIAVLNDEVFELRLSLHIASNAQAAAAATRAAALASMRRFTGPMQSIDVDAALTDAQKLRDQIEQSSDMAKVVAHTAKFAVRLAERFT